MRGPEWCSPSRFICFFVIVSFVIMSRTFRCSTLESESTFSQGSSYVSVMSSVSQRRPNITSTCESTDDEVEGASIASLSFNDLEKSTEASDEHKQKAFEALQHHCKRYSNNSCLWNMPNILRILTSKIANLSKWSQNEKDRKSVV